MADTQENRLRQLLYAITSGQVSAHKRRASGYSRKHRRGSDRAYTRHAWKAAQAAKMQLAGFTKPENHYERVARSLMMGVAKSKRWKKYMRRADKARLDPSLAYDFKRAGRDPRFGLTIEGTEIVTRQEKAEKAKKALAHFFEVYHGGPVGVHTPIRMPGDKDDLLGDRYRREIVSGERTNVAKDSGNKGKKKPSDREVGTPSLTQQYSTDTPRHPPMREDTLQTIKNVVLEFVNYSSRLSTSGGSKSASRGARRGSRASPAGVKREANKTRRGGMARKVRVFGRYSAGARRNATAEKARSLAAKVTKFVSQVAQKRVRQQGKNAQASASLKNAARFPR